MDDLSIIKNGSEIFHDGFDGGGPPPSAPYYIGTGFTGSYFTDAATGGTFIEDAANGRLIMAGRFGSDILDAVPTGQIIHHAATLNTNTQPLNVSTLGLKSDDDFEVVGRFDLSLPEDPGENYGIRLHDGADSNDIIRLEVRRSTDPGNPVQVALTRLDLSANTFTIDETITLSPPAGVDQIVLRLSHDADAPGIIHAAFDLYDHGSFVSTTDFTTTETIFHGEDWTQVQIVATEAVENDQVYVGDYGVLYLDPDGNWKYGLRNGLPAVEAAPPRRYHRRPLHRSGIRWCRRHHDAEHRRYHQRRQRCADDHRRSGHCRQQG